jgi:hypothetical protein
LRDAVDWCLQPDGEPKFCRPRPGLAFFASTNNWQLLPNVVNQALVANERAKYLMTLLQAAREHADNPDGRFTIVWTS